MKTKRVTIYIGITPANDWEEEGFYSDAPFSRYLYRGKTPQRVVEQINTSYFRTLVWDIGVITFKVKE